MAGNLSVRSLAKMQHPHFPGRAPATKLCVSPDEARQWLEAQAADFALPIKWVSEIPGGGAVTRTHLPELVPPDLFC